MKPPIRANTYALSPKTGMIPPWTLTTKCMVTDQSYPRGAVVLVLFPRENIAPARKSRLWMRLHLASYALPP